MATGMNGSESLIHSSESSLPPSEENCSFELEQDSHCNSLLAELWRSRDVAGFADTVLCVDGEEIPAHRAVLAASSPYFKAMFSSELRESRESQVRLYGLHASTLRVLIEYAYLGHLKLHVDSAQELLAAASMLLYPTVVEACSSLLQRFLSAANCLGLEEFAAAHACESLRVAARLHATQNFEDVVQSEEFLQLSATVMQQYLSSNDIDVLNELSVFNGLLQWTNHDREARLPSLPVLLRHVRLSFIGAKQLEAALSDPAVLKCRVSQQLLSSALESAAAPSEPRPSTVARQLLMVVGGVDETGAVLSSCELFDPHKKRWTEAPDLPQALRCFSAVTLEGVVYVTGGFCSVDGRLEASTSVWCFDAHSRSWRAACSLLSPRACHTSATLGGRVVVLGGVTKLRRRAALEQLEAYDPLSNKWEVVGRTPFPRRDSRAVGLGDSVLEVGGVQGEACVDTMTQYRLVAGPQYRLEYVSEHIKLPKRLQHSQLFAVDETNYLILWEDSKWLIMLKPSKRTFETLQPMRHSHVQGAATLVNGALCVCGGWDNPKPPSVLQPSSERGSGLVELYDCKRQAWSVLTELRQQRAQHVFVTLSL